MAEQEYVSLDDAAKALKVTRGTLHYYIRTLKLETKKFPLDKRAYLSSADFNQIRTLKEAAAERGKSSEQAA